MTEAHRTEDPRIKRLSAVILAVNRARADLALSRDKLQFALKALIATRAAFKRKKR